MSTRLLISPALLAWGWQTGWWSFALPMLMALEAARWASWRWEFSTTDFNRLVDLTNLLFIGVSIYLFLEHGSRGVFQIIKWLPLVLFLLLLAQRYSTAGALTMGNLFLGLRRARGEAAEWAGRKVHLDIPYLGICLLAVFIEAGHSPWLWWLMLAFLIFSLLPWRSRRYPITVWVLSLCLVTGLGYLLQHGIRNLHGVLEEAALAWFERHDWSRRNPYWARTAIGDLGRLKLSDKIMLRVSNSGGKQPALLRQASYQSYRYGTWQAVDDQFKAVDSIAQETWLLDQRPASQAAVTITGTTDRGRAVLALPGATRQIRLLLAGAMQRNPLGTVRIQDGPDFLRYTARYAATSWRDQAPTDHDLTITDTYREVIQSVAERLQLSQLDPQQAVAALRDMFQSEYRYSLVQRSFNRAKPALLEFLTETRAGHCEFFATASTLLLRAAGIPARYATGYSVQEFSPWEDAWLVRRRHAHSWTIAFIDGQWQDVDLTPPVWFPEEAQQASAWEPVSDLFSWLFHRFQVWRWQEEEAEEESGTALLWLLLPLSLFLAWRLYHQKTTRRQTGKGTGSASGSAQRSPSPFDAVEAHLANRQIPRRRGETMAAWIARLQGEDPDLELTALLRQHYQLRFDPLGFSALELQQFSSDSRAWLDQAS